MGAKVPAAASENHLVTRQTLTCVESAVCVGEGPQQDQLILVSGPDFHSPLELKLEFQPCYFVVDVAVCDGNRKVLSYNVP